VTIPRALEGAGTAGKRLWRAVLSEFELAEHEQVLLRQAVRVADLCDQLQAVVEAEGPVLRVDGQPRMHPAVVELRQQRIVLARLVVALRVPLGDQEQDAGSAEGSSGPQRLQRRGVRGFYSIAGGEG
jgi:hypothetical protein